MDQSSAALMSTDDQTWGLRTPVGRAVKPVNLGGGNYIFISLTSNLSQTFPSVAKRRPQVTCCLRLSRREITGIFISNNSWCTDLEAPPDFKPADLLPDLI